MKETMGMWRVGSNEISITNMTTGHLFNALKLLIRVAEYRRMKRSIEFLLQDANTDKDMTFSGEMGQPELSLEDFLPSQYQDLKDELLSRFESDSSAVNLKLKVYVAQVRRAGLDSEMKAVSDVVVSRIQDREHEIDIDEFPSEAENDNVFRDEWEDDDTDAE
jgi:hypothetical protein